MHPALETALVVFGTVFLLAFTFHAPDQCRHHVPESSPAAHGETEGMR